MQNNDKQKIITNILNKTLGLDLEQVKFKNIESVENNLYPILSNKNIFLVDLYDYNINLGKRIENYFKEMIKGVGAVKECLNKYIK